MNFLIYGAKDYLSHDEFNLNNYKELIKNKIIFYKGYKENVASIFQNSCIFCLPSYREGMPKSVLEASAAGIPSVVTNTVGCKEVIINNKTGLLVKPKDYKDLSLKIEMLIKNKNLRNSFLKIKKFARINSSLELVTKKIFNLYENKKKLIVISLNELNFDVIDHYIKKYNLKNLEEIKRNLSYTHSEKEYKFLEP